jgi:DNA-binding MarR family transcriptional regulator
MNGAELLELALDLARRARLLLEEDELTIRQYHALGAVGERPLRVGELSRLLEIRTPSTVALLDVLAGRGLVRRVPDLEDGRASVVELTAAGRRRHSRAEQRLVSAFAELAASLELPGRLTRAE